jgi:hypothetical protein
MSRFRPPLLAALALAALAAAPAAAVEWFHISGNGLPGGGISDSQPVASAGQSGSLHWDVTASRGRLDLYGDVTAGCCWGLLGWNSKFQADDVVFSSPGGGGGQALVTVNVSVHVEAAFVGSCDACCAGTHTAYFGLAAALAGNYAGSGWQWWNPAGACGSNTSSPMYGGAGGDVLDGVFTFPVAWWVPLDVPTTFLLEAPMHIGAGMGQYAEMGAVVTLPTTGPIFTILDGPAGVTVDSAQLNIVANGWLGIAAAGDVTGDFTVDVQDLLAVLAAWGACPGCPEDTNGDDLVDITDLLQVLADWS